MPTRSRQHRIGNLDDRVDRIEQILPTLATRDDLNAAIAPLATRDEWDGEIARSRDQLRNEIAETRRYMTVLYEDLRDTQRVIIEHLVSLSARVDALSQR